MQEKLILLTYRGWRIGEKYCEGWVIEPQNEKTILALISDWENNPKYFELCRVKGNLPLIFIKFYRFVKTHQYSYILYRMYWDL